jgi:hypothetical protein
MVMCKSRHCDARSVALVNGTTRSSCGMPAISGRERSSASMRFASPTDSGSRSFVTTKTRTRSPARAAMFRS